MRIHGQFRIWLPKDAGEIFAPEPDIIMPNRVTDEGEQEFLKMIFQNVTEIAGGANWYIGLCNQLPAEADILTSISTEPAVSNGYAREALVRSAVGWPTLTVINGHTVMRSAAVTFTAAGGAFSAAFTRLFLTDQSSGTAGKLYAYSGALTAEITLADTQSFQAQYEVFLD